MSLVPVPQQMSKSIQVVLYMHLFSVAPVDLNQIQYSSSKCSVTKVYFVPGQSMPKKSARLQSLMSAESHSICALKLENIQLCPIS